MDFFSAPWKFPGQKGTDPSHGHSPRGRAPRPGLELRRGIRNRSVNKTFVLGMPFESVSVKLQPGIRVTSLNPPSLFLWLFLNSPVNGPGVGEKGVLSTASNRAIRKQCPYCAPSVTH